MEAERRDLALPGLRAAHRAHRRHGRMIRDIRRGPDLASIELTANDGRVLRVLADGLGADEVRRHREELLVWLKGSGIPLVEDAGPRQ